MITTCQILNYNDSETTIDLIKKIRDYSVFDYIIVIDNFSTDDSMRKLRDIISDKILLIQTEKNGGYGYGNNFGIRYSYENLKADYTLVINPDVDFSEHTVIYLLDYLKKNNDVAIISCLPTLNLKELTYARKKTTGFQDVLSASLIFNKLLKSRYYPKDYFNNKKFCEVYEIPGSFLLINLKIMLDYGMYDEDIFLFEEEKILAYKFFQSGFKTILSLEHEYVHYGSISIKKTYKSEVRKKKLLLNSRLTYLEKYKKYNKFKLFLVKIFFGYTLFEMALYSFLKKIFSK